MKLVQVSEQLLIVSVGSEIARRQTAGVSMLLTRENPSVVCYGSGGAVYAALLLQSGECALW